MRVLLDTNIIIYREASKASRPEIGVLFLWLDKLHLTKCVHPLTAQELSRHAVADTVSTMQVKLSSYHIIRTEAPIHPSVKTVSEKEDRNPNDIEDSKLLNEVVQERVDILISEDKKIHRKANMLKITNRVFSIESFLKKVTAENPDLVDYKVLAVKKELFGNINLSDPFFDSFREDYQGFDTWFSKKEGEIAYVYYESGALAAFLFLKPERENENYSDIKPIFLRKKRLKIGTLKVTTNGIKIGERLLKIIFDNARQYKVDEIYVTIFDRRSEQIRLIALLEEWGFLYYGIKSTASGEEKVYVRDMTKDAEKDNPKFTYPKLSKDSQTYIIPIRPEYHTELFPDSILKTESPLDFIELKPHRNAIAKSYISHSLNRNLLAGDTIVFYMSGGIYKGVATTIGIVEEVITEIRDVNHLIEICRKRTVLSNEELQEYWDWKPWNRPFVINFLYAYSFKKRMNLKMMLDEKILPDMSIVSTINPIPHESLVKLIKLSGI